MPVSKCPNGKYRIGSGKCMYDSKAKAEAAYSAYLAQKHSSKNEEILSIKELIEEELKELKEEAVVLHVVKERIQNKLNENKLKIKRSDLHGDFKRVRRIRNRD